jgi:hypothetical protein
MIQNFRTEIIICTIETINFQAVENFSGLSAQTKPTWFIELKISSSFSPAPRRKPTVLFLDRLTKQVSIMSPDPDKPDKVVAFPPICMSMNRSQKQTNITILSVNLFSIIYSVKKK